MAWRWPVTAETCSKISPNCNYYILFDVCCVCMIFFLLTRLWRCNRGFRNVGTYQTPWIHPQERIQHSEQGKFWNQELKKVFQTDTFQYRHKTQVLHTPTRNSVLTDIRHNRVTKRESSLFHTIAMCPVVTLYVLYVRNLIL